MGFPPRDRVGDLSPPNCWNAPASSSLSSAGLSQFSGLSFLRRLPPHLNLIRMVIWKSACIWIVIWVPSILTMVSIEISTTKTSMTASMTVRCFCSRTIVYAHWASNDSTILCPSTLFTEFHTSYIGGWVFKGFFIIINEY